MLQMWWPIELAKQDARSQVENSSNCEVSIEFPLGRGQHFHVRGEGH